MIVLEGLRSLLESSHPEIRIVELDLRKGPRRSVDVTLLDTYGEPQTLDERVPSLGADPENGAIVVFSFSDRPQAVRRALRAGAQGARSAGLTGCSKTRRRAKNFWLHKNHR